MYTLHISKVKKVELPKRVSYPMVGTEGIKSDRMSFGIAVLGPKTKMDPHKHVNEEEIIFIIEGFGKVHFADGSSEVIEPGTVIVAPKNVDHLIENESSNPMKWCWVFSPPIKTGSHTSPGTKIDR